MKFNKILFLFAALTCTNTLAKDTTTPEAEEKRPNKPLVITGDKIQPLSDTHWRIKVSYAEAVKVRCVAFDEKEQAVAIDSIAVIPPFSVSDMYTREDDGKIEEVKCWVTSTRTEDLAKDYIRHDTHSHESS